MFAPPAFHKLCNYFFQDIGLNLATPEEWISFASRHLTDNEKSAVQEFLTALLNANHDEQELQTLWFDSGAEIYFPETKDLRGFLTMIRDRIVKS